MATRVSGVTAIPQTVDNLAVSMVNWGSFPTASPTPLLNTDVGAAVQLPQKATMSFHAVGTFGAGGSVAIEGSNDGTNFFVIKDLFGTAVALTAAAPIAVVPGPYLWVRPHVTAGDGTTSVVVNGCFRTTRQG